MYLHRVATASRPEVSPEAAFLLSCMRSALGHEPHEAGPPAADLDWSLLVPGALAHGVMPHLHRQVETETPRVPVAVRDHLAQHFADNARLNLFRAGVLRELLALFEAEAIRAVPLKGPVLAMSIYRSLAMRQFTDLDLLVPADSAGPAEALLRAQGFTVRATSDTAVTLVRRGSPCSVAIDLQWALAEPRYSLAPLEQSLWRGLVRVPFMNLSIWQPTLEDQLLLLCAHPAKHCWSKLGWIGDLAGFVVSHGDRIDWPLVLDRADRAGMRRLLLVGLSIAADLLHVQPPGAVRARIDADRPASALAAELSSAVCETSNGLRRLNGSYGVVEAGLLFIRTRERFVDKLPYLRYLARLLWQWCAVMPNECDRAVVALPWILSPLYFLIRPFRLAVRYGRRVLRSGIQFATAFR